MTNNRTRNLFKCSNFLSKCRNVPFQNYHACKFFNDNHDSFMSEEKQVTQSWRGLNSQALVSTNMVKYKFDDKT